MMANAIRGENVKNLFYFRINKQIKLFKLYYYFVKQPLQKKKTIVMYADYVKKSTKKSDENKKKKTRCQTRVMRKSYVRNTVHLKRLMGGSSPEMHQLSQPYLRQ